MRDCDSFLNSVDEHIPSPDNPAEVPEGEWHDGWIDVTNTVKRISKLHIKVTCHCGNEQKTYAERSWCRCRECFKIMIDEGERMSYKEYIENEQEEEESSIGDIIESEKE